MKKNISNKIQTPLSLFLFEEVKEKLGTTHTRELIRELDKVSGRVLENQGNSIRLQVWFES